MVPEEGELTGESVLLGLESHGDLEKLYEKLNPRTSLQGQSQSYAEMHSLSVSYQNVDNYADEYLQEMKDCNHHMNQGHQAQVGSTEKLAGFIDGGSDMEPKSSMRKWEAKQVGFDILIYETEISFLQGLDFSHSHLWKDSINA